LRVRSTSVVGSSINEVTRVDRFRQAPPARRPGRPEDDGNAGGLQGQNGGRGAENPHSRAGSGSITRATTAGRRPGRRGAGRSEGAAGRGGGAGAGAG